MTAQGPVTIVALYKFCPLPDSEALRAPLLALCEAEGIRGTLLLAPEGINGTVAGPERGIKRLITHLETDPAWAGRFAGAEVKYSHAGTMPFPRLKVRLKPEIVTLRAPEADPNTLAGTYVAPEDWNDVISRDDVVVIDTRNDYEVAIGSFANAIDPKTRSFTEFKQYVEDELDPRSNKAVAMYCTGGIRCEKASAYLRHKGFETVYHLKGGILAYLEQVPESESLWEGACFVFDERVSVTHGLKPGEHQLCRACRMPLTDEDRAHPDHIEGVQCVHCAGEKGEKARRRARERQRQIEIARARGQAHIGDDARAAAEKNKAAAKRKRAADRARATKS